VVANGGCRELPPLGECTWAGLRATRKSLEDRHARRVANRQRQCSILGFPHLERLDSSQGGRNGGSERAIRTFALASEVEPVDLATSRSRNSSFQRGGVLLRRRGRGLVLVDGEWIELAVAEPPVETVLPEPEVIVAAFAPYGCEILGPPPVL
jgi:hypothetical protein